MAGIKNFSLPIRIYFEDTDSGGIVYHANYLKFMERARTEWLRSIQIDQRLLKQKEHVMFVVHRMDIQYKLPARFNDELLVKTELVEIGSSKIVFKQMIYRHDEMLIDAVVNIACIDSEKFKPVRVPKTIKHTMESL
ncbi:MAG: tol-pal system-associated acyl-CoA thioesterase [Candidatus Methylopumilus sp.]|nr:tol-pal system-associated acyl-CoA thioesterase [Candidatus Methylopumilus sp.]